MVNVAQCDGRAGVGRRGRCASLCGNSCSAERGGVHRVFMAFTKVNNVNDVNNVNSRRACSNTPRAQSSRLALRARRSMIVDDGSESPTRSCAAPASRMRRRLGSAWLAGAHYMLSPSPAAAGTKIVGPSPTSAPLPSASDTLEIIVLEGTPGPPSMPHLLPISSGWATAFASCPRVLVRSRTPIPISTASAPTKISLPQGQFFFASVNVEPPNLLMVLASASASAPAAGHWVKKNLLSLVFPHQVPKTMTCGWLAAGYWH